MPIRFLCSNCRKALEMDDTDAGREVLCFYCQSRNNVPEQSDPQELLESAPVTQEPISVRKSPVIGSIGLLSSIAMILSFIFFFSWGLGKGYVPLVRDPHFQTLTLQQQKTLVQQKFKETAKQPIMRFAQYSVLVFFLISLGFSIAGIASNSGKRSAIAGLIITLLMVLLVILTTLSTHTRPPG